MTSIIQDWASELGLRHQGVLVSAIRGCDGQLRDSPEKPLIRFYRSCILNAHCGHPKDAVSYMVWPKNDIEMFSYTGAFFKGGLDHYPMHWLTHFMFATEILGYHYPIPEPISNDCEYNIKDYWNVFYHTLVRKLHLNPETKEELDKRLNANEAVFGFNQTVDNI